jgi:hypothetical protein
MDGSCDVSCKVQQDLEPLQLMQELRIKCVEEGQLLPAHMIVIEGLRKEDNMMQSLKTNRGKWAVGLPVKNLTGENAEVVYHAGCRYSFDEELWPVARGGLQLLMAAGVDVGIIGTSPFSEGNDEEWAAMQAIRQKMAQSFDPAGGVSVANSVVCVIGYQSQGEKEYKEKCLRTITEKWGGRFLPGFNEPRALARAFADIMWSNGVNLRATGDFLPSSSSPDGSPAMLKTLALKEGEVKRRYEKSGAFLSMGGGSMVSWRPEEHLAIGAQGISTGPV